MPKRTTYTRRFVTGRPIHQDLGRTQDGFLVGSYWTANAEGDKTVYAGAILAELEGGILESDMTVSQPYFVPYSATAAYGAGSDTAAGILAEDWDATYSDWQITLVNHGVAIEKYCYEPGGVYGDISDAVKTDLSNINWRT